MAFGPRVPSADSDTVFPQRAIARGLTDGLIEARRITEEKRARIAERRERGRGILDGFDVVGAPRASHLWLGLPEGWRSDPFVLLAADSGVRITGAGTFSISRHVPAGVRLPLGRPGSLEAMVAGVEAIREILEEGPVSSTTVI